MEIKRKVPLRLSEANFEKLRGLVIQRDSELWEVYKEYFDDPFPEEYIHVHHVVPRGSQGSDKEENLVSLAGNVHKYKFHTGFGSVDKKYQQKAQAYLESEEVKEWRECHMEELKRIYATAEPTRAKKIRDGCNPKKRPGLPF